MVSGWNKGGSVLCGILLNGMAENSVFHLKRRGGKKESICAIAINYCCAGIKYAKFITFIAKYLVV